MHNRLRIGTEERLCSLRRGGPPEGVRDKCGVGYSEASGEAGRRKLEQADKADIYFAADGD